MKKYEIQKKIDSIFEYLKKQADFWKRQGIKRQELQKFAEAVRLDKKDPHKQKCKDCGGSGNWENCMGNIGFLRAEGYNQAVDDLNAKIQNYLENYN